MLGREEETDLAQELAEEGKVLLAEGHRKRISRDLKLLYGRFETHWYQSPTTTVYSSSQVTSVRLVVSLAMMLRGALSPSTYWPL